MKFFTSLLSIFFIFLILNHEIVINAHDLSLNKASVVQSLRAKVEKALKNPSLSSDVTARLVSKGQKEGANASFKASLAINKDKAALSTSKPNLKDKLALATNKPNLKDKATTIAETRAKFFPLLIVLIVLIVVIVILATAKKIVDKVAEKELKEISKEINKAKLNQMMLRKAENKMLIQVCQGFQQARKLFKSYSILGDFAAAEVDNSFSELNNLPSKTFAPEIFTKFTKFVTSTIAKFSLWKVKYALIKHNLDESFTKYCYDGFNIRQKMEEANILGSYYTGFSDEDFSEFEASRDVLKDTLIDNKFGSEAAGELNELHLALQPGSETTHTEKFSILTHTTTDDKPTWLGDFAGASEILSSLVELKDKYKELKEGIEADEESDEKKTLKKVLDYLTFAIGAADSVISLVSGVLDFVHIEFQFPFLAVATEAVKTVKAFIEYREVKGEYNKEKKKTTPNAKELAGLDFQKSLKFWDLLDQGFSFIQEIADLVMTLLAGVTVGVSKIISYAIKAFVAGARLAFSAVKLAKIRASKDNLIKYIKESSTEETDASEKLKKKILDEQCSVYTTLLQSIVEKEFHEIDEILHKKKKELVTQEKLLTDRKLSSAIVLNDEIATTKKRLITDICTKDKEYCVDFINTIELDLSFLNSNSPNYDATASKLVKDVSFEKAAGEPNSVISVFKGRFASALYTGEDQQYGQELIQTLLKNNYTLVFDTPRFSIFKCSLCADQTISVQGIQNFKGPEEISALKTGGVVHVQDTLQFFNVKTEGSKNTDYSEYCVACLKKKPDFSTTPKFQEFLFADTVTHTSGFWIFQKTKLDAEDFRISFDISSKNKNLLRTTNHLYVVISVHQRTFEKVVPILKSNDKLNVLTTKVIMKKKQDNPSHFFFLVALDDSLSFSAFQTLIVEECKKDISGYLDYYCVLNAVDIRSFPTDFWNSDTQFSLSMEDYTTQLGTTSGLMLSDFTNNGWHTITNGYFTYQLTRGNEETTIVRVIYKQIMRYQNFPTTGKKDSDVMKEVEKKQGELRQKILESLKTAVCTTDCQLNAAHPLLDMSNFFNFYFSDEFVNLFLIAKYLKPAEKGSPKKNANICSLTNYDWIEILDEKSKTGRCLNAEELSSLQSNWKTVFQGFYPKVDISDDMGGIQNVIEEECAKEKQK